MATTYEQMMKSALMAGLPVISKDTAARILAAIYVYGGENEEVVSSMRLRVDLNYISDRFGIRGCGTLPADMYAILRKYVEELEDYVRSHKSDSLYGDRPEWVEELFLRRYGFEI